MDYCFSGNLKQISPPILGIFAQVSASHKKMITKSFELKICKGETNTAILINSSLCNH